MKPIRTCSACPHTIPSLCQASVVLHTFKMKSGFLDNLYNVSLSIHVFKMDLDLQAIYDKAYLALSILDIAWFEMHEGSSPCSRWFTLRILNIHF